MHSLFCRLILMQPDIFLRRLFSPEPLIPMSLPSPREMHFWYVLPAEVQNTSLLNKYLKLLSSVERVFCLCMQTSRKGLSYPEPWSVLRLHDVLKIAVKPCRDTEILTADWDFALFELATSHYAAICVKKQDAVGGVTEQPATLKVWKVVPFVSDECVSGTKSWPSVVVLNNRSERVCEEKIAVKYYKHAHLLQNRRRCTDDVDFKEREKLMKETGPPDFPDQYPSVDG